MKKGLTLIELLVVVLIIGIVAAVALPSYLRSVERSRASEVETLFGRVVTGQNLLKMNKYIYTENWPALQGAPGNVNDGKLYCVRGKNVAGRVACDRNTTYEVKLFGTDVPNPEAAVIATRKNNKQYGEYQLYRFYEEAPAKVYCKSDTKDGQELCLEFLETDTYVEPSRNPPNVPKQVVKTESCGTNCEMVYYDDGSKTQTDYNPDGSIKNRTNYDAETGKMTDKTNYNADGSVSVRNNYDAETGKMINYTVYNADGSVNYRDDYDAVTGLRTDTTAYRADGSVNYRDHYDLVAGKMTSRTVYNADGSLNYRTNYDAVTGQQADRTFYKADGSVNSHICYSGACKEPGYTPPTASAYPSAGNYPNPGNLCDSYPGEKQCQ